MELIAGYDPTSKDYYFDDDAANKAVQFCERLLTHVKGPKARQPLILEQWQRLFIKTLFGWKHKETGLRRYRQAALLVPRKQGKTTLAALVGLYMLLCDGELGAEIYLAASSRDQSSILYDIIAGMIRQQPALASRVRALDSRKRIIYPNTNSFLTAIAAEAGTQHGTNASCIVYDELHSAPNRDLYDVLQTSQGARLQPLFLVISTAGYDEHSIMAEVWRYAQQVRDGIIKDDTFLPAIYEADKKDDWTSPKTWAKANPNLGVSVSQDFLQKECNKAREIAAYENTFRRLYLNQWTEQAERWLPIEHWQKCYCADWPQLNGAECYGGLDLSSTKDLSAFALAFPMRNQVFLKCWAWIPKDNAKAREDRDRVPYRLWSKDASITLTPGNVIDYHHIEHKILELAERYDIKQIAYDRWNSNQIVTDLEAEGLLMAAHGQGYASMSSASKELEKRILEHTLRHSNNPVLNWNISNVAVASDPSGNIKPVKPEHKSAKRIDCVVASIMALSGIIARGKEEMIYNSRGIVAI